MKLKHTFRSFVFSVLTYFLIHGLLFRFGGHWNEEPNPKAVFVKNYRYKKEINAFAVDIFADRKQTTPNSVHSKTQSVKATTTLKVLLPATKFSSLITRTKKQPSVTTILRSTTSTTAKTITVATTIGPASKIFYICTSKAGRLGNNLFQFATSFGVAFSKGMTAVTPKWGPVNAVFNLTKNRWLEIAPDNSLCRGAKSRRERLGSGFDQNLIDFKADSSYTLNLHLQSWRYFNESIPELRTQLAFRSNIQNKANDIFDNIWKKHGKSTRSDVTFIAIHIRRGDMVNNSLGYQVATSDYLKRAVKLFSNIGSRIFVVCSDDMKWSKANMPGSEEVEYVTGNSREVDMAVLASCDHIITTVGSFSWWSGFLNKGTVVYFKWPAKEGSRLRQIYSKDYSDYFMPHWIGL